MTAVVAVAYAAGCTGAPAPTASAGALDLAGQRLEVIGEWTGQEQANFQAVLHAFESATRAAVTYTSGGNNVNVLINSRIAGGRPPDVALIPQPGVVAQYARRGVLTPLAGDAAAAANANYSTPWRELASVDGTPYGVFFKVANKSVVWYRVDDFARAGVQPPKTWDDFGTVSRALADSGVTPMAIPAGDGWPVTDWFENIYLRVAGGDRYAKLTAHRIPWTDPSVVRSLQLLGQYAGAPHTIEAGATQLSFTQSVADVFGEKPVAAMLYEGDFVAGEIAKLGAAKVGTDARFFEFPAIDGSPRAVISAGDEAVQFNDTPAARALMAYLASPAAAEIWAAKGGFLSANKNLDTSAYPDDTTRQLADALVAPALLRFDMSDQTPQSFGGQTGADEWRILTDFIGDPRDPAAAASALQAAADKDFGSG